MRAVGRMVEVSNSRRGGVGNREKLERRARAVASAVEHARVQCKPWQCSDGEGSADTGDTAGTCWQRDLVRGRSAQGRPRSEEQRSQTGCRVVSCRGELQVMVTGWQG